MRIRIGGPGTGEGWEAPNTSPDFYLCFSLSQQGVLSFFWGGVWGCLGVFGVWGVLLQGCVT